MLSECPEGYYGESCAEKCMCMNGASCDSETGSCICKTGWRGRLCGKGRVQEKNELILRWLGQTTSFNWNL